MEAGEYGLRRGMCLVSRRLEVVAVDGLLGMPWYVLGGADFYFYFSNFILRTQTAYCKYEATLLHLHIYQ